MVWGKVGASWTKYLGPTCFGLLSSIIIVLDILGQFASICWVLLRLFATAYLLVVELVCWLGSLWAFCFGWFVSSSTQVLGSALVVLHFVMLGFSWFLIEKLALGFGRLFYLVNSIITIRLQWLLILPKQFVISFSLTASLFQSIGVCIIFNLT